MPDFSGFFTREVKLFLVGTLGVAVLAASLTALIMLLSGRPDANPYLNDPAAARAAAEGMKPFSLPEGYPLQRDLILPAEDPSWLRRERQPYREKKTQWSTGDVMEFWIDPREIGIDILEQRNRETLERMFREVP